MKIACKRGKIIIKRLSTNGAKGHSKTLGRDKNINLCQRLGK